MEAIRNWLLPLLLAAAQLAFWPGRPLADGEPVGAVRLAAALALAAVATVALGLRRRRPVAATLGVEAALLAALALRDAALLLGLGVPVALYSVTVRCPGRTAALVGAALTLSGAVRAAAQLSGAEAVGESLVNLALYVTVAGLGRSRRRWLTGRKTAARDLARAEAERCLAATTERERLARELHDVSAHHLTSVVITADTALRLGARREGLAAQALEFAAESGRATLASLHRLVALMRTSAADEESPLSERVDELAAGFARLGARPAVDIAPDLAALTGPVADAAFGIVREALTNALRYAPGAAVRVRLRVAGSDGAVELTVEDDGAPGGGALTDRRWLGSGRGTAGMRERAAALGGTLDAGPRADRPGWAVRARLPRTRAVLHDRAARHPLLRGLDPADGATVLAVAVLPLFVLLAERPAATAVACGPAVAQALPLLWRRRAPWTALCAVLASAFLAPAGVAAGLLTTTVGLCLVAAGGVAAAVAVHAVGAFAGPPRVTWTVLPVAAAGLSLLCVGLAAANGGAGSGGADAKGAAAGGALVFIVWLLGAAFLLPVALPWTIGAVTRTRRERVKAYEDHALTETVRAAVAAAHAERHRIAEELRGEVLRHAAEVVTSAERGDLQGVADEARAGLAAMRGLLAALRETSSAGDPGEPGKTARPHLSPTP
ncbi:sensor histidine kinase [Streptomyces flavofungini]|uniref:sensor histidine kinase n=1 Tax=Streptomyces flavofungini TaxID=68200 RepID=UPI0034E02E01